MTRPRHRRRIPLAAALVALCAAASVIAAPPAPLPPAAASAVPSAVPSTAPTAPTAPSPQDVRAGTACAAFPSLHGVQALDLGDVRIQRGRDGYLSVSPRGEVVSAVSVMVRRAPLPAELELCGDANQDIAILIQQPSLRLAAASGQPVAREVRDLRVEADGMALHKVAEGRWEGRLGPTGRARVRVGATVYFSASGTHGSAGADLDIDVVPR